MPTSPKATTHPGGAPLRKTSRPCKYGPRDEEGKCPKKPRSTTSRTTSARKPATKKPCKYGPRDSNGLCPKKPKTARAARAPQVKELKSVDGAARQAGEVIRSKKATKEQKKEAVKVLGNAVAGEVARKVAVEVKREAKKAVKQNPAVKKAAVAVAKKAGKAAAGATAVGAITYAGGAALTANRERVAKQYADKQLRATKAKLPPNALTPEQEAVLWRQYYDHKMREAVQNTYLGK